MKKHSVLSEGVSYFMLNIREPTFCSIRLKYYCFPIAVFFIVEAICELGLVYSNTYGYHGKF